MERLSKKSIFSYGLGDLASQLLWSFIGSYLTVYYIDVVGLAPLAVSTLMMAAKVWDAVNDPIMGGICERTKSKYGRFRPYMLYGAPFLAIFTVLTFTAPFGKGTTAVVWATITYIGAGMLYTLVNIPYGALAGVMTIHDEERVKLNSVRGVGMQIGMFIINFASSLLLLAVSGSSDTVSPKSYTIVALLFAVVSMPMFFMVFKNTKEIIHPKVSQEKVTLKTSLKVILTNKFLMIIVIGQLVFMIGNMGRISVMAFYVQHCLGDFKLMSLLMTLPSIGSLLGNIISPVLVKHMGAHGKRNVLVASEGIKGLALIAIFFIPFENIPLIVAAHVVFALAGFGFPSTLAMVTDSIDYQDEKTGVRSDGIAYACYGLSTKMGNAFGGSIGIMLLAAFGYTAGSEVTAAAQHGINLAANLIPGIFFLVSTLIFFIFWKMTDKEADEIRVRITERNANENN